MATFNRNSIRFERNAQSLAVEPLQFRWCHNMMQRVNGMAKAILDRHGGSSPEIESDKTTDTENANESDESKENDELQSYLDYAARGFFAVSPDTRVIVTCGSKGAAALHEGQLVCFQPAPRIESAALLDTTGAGDAFAAAFLHRILQLPKEHSSTWPSSEALKDALRWGCAVGTASVTKVGASIPSSQKEIDSLLLICENCRTVTADDVIK
eukprot:scaffold11322_cov45-Attheya_sp.AAC.5